MRRLGTEQGVDHPLAYVRTFVHSEGVIGRASGFNWDDGNRAKCVKHGVSLAEIETHTELYAALLADMDDAAFRAEMTGFDGAKTSSGSFIVNHVIAQCAAYRTQLFMYLKACGREELSTMNLWVGVDPPVAV